MEEGVGKRGEGCEREGRGFETSQQQIFLLFFFFLGGTKMPFIVTDRFLRGSKTFNAKLMRTINCQIHGIQN